MLPFLIKAKNIFAEALFPPLCLGCEKYLERAENFLCADCLNSIVLNNTLFCPVCRSRLPNNQKICHFNAKFLFGAATDYNNQAISQLMRFFKFKSFENVSLLLSGLLINYAKTLDLDFNDYIVTAIPLPKKRRRQRGFNQSELIAKNFAAYFNLNFSDCLRKTKNTKPQTELKQKERLENISGSFIIKKSSDEIAGKNIILIDDVFTTGATITEAVNVLKTADVHKILCLTIAKT